MLIQIHNTTLRDKHWARSTELTFVSGWGGGGHYLLQGFRLVILMDSIWFVVMGVHNYVWLRQCERLPLSAISRTNCMKYWATLTQMDNKIYPNQCYLMLRSLRKCGRIAWAACVTCCFSMSMATFGLHEKSEIFRRLPTCLDKNCLNVVFNT